MLGWWWKITHASLVGLGLLLAVVGFSVPCRRCQDRRSLLATVRLLRWRVRVQSLNSRSTKRIFLGLVLLLLLIFRNINHSNTALWLPQIKSAASTSGSGPESSSAACGLHETAKHWSHLFHGFDSKAYTLHKLPSVHGIFKLALNSDNVNDSFHPRVRVDVRHPRKRRLIFPKIVPARDVYTIRLSMTFHHIEWSSKIKLTSDWLQSNYHCSGVY